MAAIAEKPEKVNGRMAKKEKAAKGPETGSKMDALMDQNPNLKMAFQQIEKQFGEGDSPASPEMRDAQNLYQKTYFRGVGGCDPLSARIFLVSPLDGR